MLPKVSVVVPIYKVEKYLNRCVESILNQTYSNLEIILVNDGSPDQCGEMANNFESADRRVKVIHKENGGLSDARNSGMQAVTGEYTLFVDSDDWLEANMIDVMVKKSMQFNADIVQTAFYYAYHDHLQLDNRYHLEEEEPTILNNKRLMYELVTNVKVKNFAWGKLYKTSFIKNIPFRVGILFEDVFWAHLVMHKVQTYVILHQPLYYYYQRRDSIVATYTTNNLAIITGLKERHCFIEKNYKEIINDSYKSILKMCLIHYSLLMLNRSKDSRGKHRKEIRLYIKKNLTQFKQAAQADPQLKKQLHLFNIHPTLNFTYLIARKLLRILGLTPKPKLLKRINF